MYLHKLLSDFTSVQDLQQRGYQAILIGPEMCLEHDGFRELLKSARFTVNLLAVVVDEAHCISQWGGDFRTTYSRLGDLRTFMPPEVPILATSATLAPAALKEIHRRLHINPTLSFFLNLGNDRPNITPSVYSMKNASDYPALLSFVTDGVVGPNDLTKMIIFTNNIQQTLEIQRFLRHHLPVACSSCVDIFHSLCSPRSKKRTLKRFRKSNVKVLVATKAAGMVRASICLQCWAYIVVQGADIPDIELVIQFGVPSSIEVWTQRAGRAGRSPDLQARAILIVEQSMFQQQKKPKKRQKTDCNIDIASLSEGDSETENEAEGLTWKKNVDPVMRGWIESTGCRRDFSDKYFDNPRSRKGQVVLELWARVKFTDLRRRTDWYLLRSLWVHCGDG